VKLKLQKHSLLDAPGECCVVYLPGCNMRCSYCYNVKLWNSIEEPSDLEISEIESFLESRVSDGPRGRFNLVDWVTISGGECLLHPDEVERLLRKATGLGLKTCLYTNGAIEEIWKVLKKLARLGLLKAVNLDYKWSVKDPELGYSLALSWAFSLKTLVTAYEAGEIERLRINTTVLRSRHTIDKLRSMKSFLFKTLSPNEKPVITTRGESNWSLPLSWTLESFFNDGGKIETLDPIDPLEAMSPTELKSLISELQ
jgi:pyruvate-formate lyase-activating enzyme